MIINKYIYFYFIISLILNGNSCLGSGSEHHNIIIDRPFPKVRRIELTCKVNELNHIDYSKSQHQVEHFWGGIMQKFCDNTPNINLEKSREYLLELSKKFPSDLFGSEDIIEQSNKNWLDNCRILKLAIALGNKDAQLILQENLESKKYSRDTVDCILTGYEEDFDEKKVRAFFWEHLACEDENEKRSLVEAYLEGNLVPLDHIRSKYWESYTIIRNPFLL